MTDSKHTSGLSRRGFLAASAAGAAALIHRPAPAQAAGGRLVVGTWGGDYARLLDKHIDQPLMKPAGYEIVQETAGDPERRAKMMAEKRMRRGSSDVQALQDSSMYQVFQQGLSHEIDYSRLPNAVNLLPNMKPNFGVYGIFSGKLVLFNPALVEKVPTSYADILSPDIASKVGMIDIQYRHNIAAAALVAGGKPTAIEEGKKLLMDLRKAGLRIYASNEAFAQALKSEEIIGGMMWKARARQWQAAGINVQDVVPSEGILPYISGFSIPKNANDVDGAYAYLNAVLDPAAQLGFAEDMGYSPTVSNAGLSDDLRKRVGFTPEEEAGMHELDLEFFLNNDHELKSWWDQQFKG